MSGQERNEAGRRTEERGAETASDRERQLAQRVGAQGKSEDSYGCVDWFDYADEAGERKRRMAH